MNKKISNDILKIIINGNNEEINAKNISEIKILTKSLFNRYSQIDINICDQKINTTNVKFDKDESINKKEKMKIITNSLNDLKDDDFMLKNNKGYKAQNKNSYLIYLII